MLKNIGAFLTISIIILLLASSPVKAAIVADHNSITQFNDIPAEWITAAKNMFRIAYQHTSHGSQITTGISVLDITPPYDYTSTFYCDYCIPGANDLGSPDRTAWESATRSLLDNPSNNKNMVMWSWCGQVSSATEADITTYLDLMKELEQDYPGVKFIYMTGHLDGSGVNGNLNQRNNQIRNFVNESSSRILFDFADIESYNPSGTYFLDKAADDGCYYDSNNDGSRDRNWADQWCAAHSGDSLCTDCGYCAHSKCLNCNMKARAFWWLMARLAGWEPNAINPSPTTPLPTPTPKPSPTSAPNIIGDLDHDQDVDIFDYNRLLQDFGLTNNSTTPADLDNDNDVDIFDYNLLLQNFGS